MSAQIGPSWQQKRPFIFLQGLTILFICTLLHGRHGKSFFQKVWSPCSFVFDWFSDRDSTDCSNSHCIERGGLLMRCPMRATSSHAGTTERQGHRAHGNAADQRGLAASTASDAIEVGHQHVVSVPQSHTAAGVLLRYVSGSTKPKSAKR